METSSGNTFFACVGRLNLSTFKVSRDKIKLSAK